MRILVITLLNLSFFAAHAQVIKKVSNPIATLERIFENFIKYDEGTDSEDNKNAMKKALISLQAKADGKELQLLINIWMYYDPTDFPTREIITPIFFKNRSGTLKAIRWRLAHKLKSENASHAPFSDLVALKKQLLKARTVQTS